MNTSIILVLLLIGLSWVPSDGCPVNEEYRLCDIPCRPTCAQFRRFSFQPPCFRAGCRTGCVCKEGYVRNFAQKCVLPSECPGF